jgi:ribosomal protein L16/L10AE
MYQVAWLNARPYCWAASIDGGKSWVKLNSDNDEDSSEAIEEASSKFGVPTNKWELLDDPIIKLT